VIGKGSDVDHKMLKKLSALHFHKNSLSLMIGKGPATNHY